MKSIVIALLAIMMVSTALGDSGSWEGAWKCKYEETPVYLVIAEDLTGYVCPRVEGQDPQGEVYAIATFTNGLVSNNGDTYTATWVAKVPQPGEGDVATLTLSRTAPNKFKGTVSWPDGLLIEFNGDYYKPFNPPS
jgi:hypothetical protein